MIRFACKACGQQIKVSDKHAGQRGRCPKCKTALIIAIVTDDSGHTSIIKFRCQNCNKKIGLKSEYAGKQVRCAQCRSPLTVPQQSVVNKSAKLHEADILQTGPTAGLKSDDCSDFGERSASDKRKVGYVLAGLNGILSLTIAAIMVSTLLDMVKRVQVSVEVNRIELGPSQAIAKQFVEELYHEHYSQVEELFSDDSRELIETDKLKSFAQQMGDPNYISFGKAAVREWDDRELLYFACWVKRNRHQRKHITFLITKESGEHKLDTASICDFRDTIRSLGAYDSAPSHRSVSVGLYSQAEIDEMNRGAVSRIDNNLDRLSGIVVLGRPRDNVIMVLVVLVSIVSLACMWRIFRNADMLGWAVLIPFYNMWVMARVGDLSGWIGIAICFIPILIPEPIISFILVQLLMVIIWRGIANTFGKSILFAVGLWLLPYIFTPLLAFSSD